MNTVTLDIDQWRISDGWFDVSGTWNPVSDQVRALLRATIDDKLQAEDQDPGPPVWFVHPGERHRLWNACDLRLEDGTEVSDSETDGGSVLPADLPLGVHDLIPRDGGPATKLFVTPAAQALPNRCWGWTVQLYSTRSRSSWGQGDLGDLATLAKWAKSNGASVISHNPLGDTLPLSAQEPSPYFTSSRKFASLLYLNVEAIPRAREILGSRLDELSNAGRALNGSPLIDRDAIYELKLTALRQIWAVAANSDQTRELIGPLGTDPELVDHATFNALAHRFEAGWDRWDRIYSHPRSRSVSSYRESHQDEVDFWIWVQGLLALQHSRAATAGAGLMNDLPVGFSQNGSDSWVDQDCLALDWRIGAPGDEFNPDGQNWGIVPYLPQKLRARVYEPWIRTLRRLMRNTSALRIDHIMGLFRLFLIPEAFEVTGGAYLYQYGTELIDIALMEAVRAGVTLAGEDLGTVESEVRYAMNERGIPGYRVGWFEDSRATDWPYASIGSISTHDLPTLTGLINGSDARQREAAGITVDPDDDQRMRANLERSVLPAGTVANEMSTDDLIGSAYRGLADSGSFAVFASLEDACLVDERPNMPGTVDEHPNWRIALPSTIEDLDSTAAPMIADVMAGRAADSDN